MRVPSRTMRLTTGCLLVCLGAALWVGPRAPALRALADQGGPIELAVCSVNSARRAALPNAELVSTIVNAVPPRARLILLVNDPDAFTIAANPWPDRVTMLDLPPDSDFTIWPQDPFVVLADPDTVRQRLLVSHRFERADDRLMADRIAGHLGWDRVRSSLRFEGGNLVADERFVFVGANTMRLNAMEQGVSEIELVRRFERELGRSVLVVGPAPQPIGHLDMMLTPLGGGRVMLADTGLGARLAEGASKDHPDRVEAFEQRCERTFFGRPDIGELRDGSGRILHPPAIVGRTGHVIEHGMSIAPLLDRVAQDLVRQGYEVIRVPLLAAGIDEPDPTSSDSDLAVESAPDRDPCGEALQDRPSPGPGYPLLTYNNVLLERDGDTHTVYLPQYGWATLDRAARRIWHDAGYRVVPVPGLTTSAMYGGSLRCCVKVLRRAAG